MNVAKLAERRTDVAVLLPSFVAGGGEAVGFFLAEILAEAGYAVDLVAARGHGGFRNREVAGVRKVDLGAITEILSLPQWLGYLRKARPRCAISLIHTANLTAGLGALFSRETPVIATFHSSVMRERRHQFWLRRYFGLGLERRLYRLMAKNTAVSNGLAREVEIAFRLPSQSVPSIPNAPLRPIEAAAPIDPAHEEIFAKPVIVAVGRLSREKDFETLMRAYAKVRAAQDCHLLILGEGKMRRELEQLAASLGVKDEVFLPGFVENPARYMRRAAAVVISSRFEGFSLVCVEALASGASIAATDCPHGPREILNGGEFGALSPVGDAAALADGIRNCFADARRPEERLRERARHLQRYSVERMRQNYLDLVNEVLDAKAPPREQALTQ